MRTQNREGNPHGMHAKTTPLATAEHGSDVSRPLSRKLPESASTRFQNELDAAIKSAADEVNLRPMVVDCLMRHRGAVGAVWFSDVKDGFHPKFERLENPALQQPIVKRWIYSTSQSAAESRRNETTRSPVVRNLALIVLPFVLPNGTTETIAWLAANSDEHSLDVDMLAGRTCVRAIMQWYARSELRDVSAQLRTTAALLELAGRIEETRDVHNATRVLADSVRDHLKCEMVAVGLKRPGRLTCKLTSLSGLAEFDPNSSRARRIKAALDESLVRNELTAWPPLPEETEHQTLAQRKLADALRCETVVSVPLRNTNGDSVGAVTVGGSCALNCPETRRFLATLDVPAGSAISVVRRAQPGFARRSLGRAFGNSGRSKLIVAALLAATISLVMMVPMPYRIACRFRCEPAEKRFCVASYDGMLRDTFVEPGDIVTRGQVLARMDDRELRYELSGLAAEQHRAGKERDVYLADELIAKSFMAALDVDRFRSRTELIENRLNNLDMRSPTAGIVLSGPVERRENYPVTVGQLLYEIAPLDPIRFDVAVAAAEMDHTEVGMKVELRADRNVSDLLIGTIKRIRPRSEVVNDRNVFIAEVEFANSDGTLRPGMEGSARVISRSHATGWNLFHRASEYIVSNVIW